MKTFILTFLFFILVNTGFSQLTSEYLGGSGQYELNLDTITTLDSNNIWQIGTPQKTIFDAALTPPNAIITDTVNFYPNNINDQFTITVQKGGGSLYMDFSHRYNTDTLLDGGTIEVSDDSINWTNIINTPYVEVGNFYLNSDTVASLNDVGFSGSSNQWVHSSVGWNRLFGSTDKLYIKFRFASDSVQNDKEGWMIDSIFFSYGTGIGIDEAIEKELFTISPNPFTDYTEIELKIPLDKNNTLTLYNAQGQLVKTITNITSGKLVIDRKELQKGLYYLQLNNDRQTHYTSKLIVE